MKKFTVKDFIAYNNPCFSCGSQISFSIDSYSKESQTIVTLRPLVNPDNTFVQLEVRYRSRTDGVDLTIFHKTNKFITNNLYSLTNYLDEHKLFMRSICYRCNTCIESGYLEFILDKNMVGAVELFYENLFFNDKTNNYCITSNFLNNKSKIAITTINDLNNCRYLDLALLPKYRFKNKQHLIEKMKLYLLFS